MSEIKVITFNLRMDNPSDPWQWQDRGKLSRAIIREADPDLIGLQEVQKHMLRDLEAEFSGDYYIFAEFRSVEAGTESTPVLAKKARFELIEEQSFMLSETPELRYSKSWDSALPRIASYLLLRDKLDGEEFIYLNTHFDHAGFQARHQSALLCRDFLRTAKEKALNCIFTGDLNAYPDAEELQPLIEDKHLENTYYSLALEQRESSLSFHDYRGGIKGKPIDYIFITEPWEFAEIAFLHQQYKGYYPSDHYPLLAMVKK